MGKFIDLTGQRFGKWLVVSRGKNGTARSARCNCVCDCGGCFEVYGFRLRRGGSTQCRACCNKNKVTIKKSGPLAQLQEELGITQNELAKRIGVSQPALLRAMQDGRELQMPNAIRAYNRSGVGPRNKKAFVLLPNGNRAAAVIANCGYCGAVVSRAKRLLDNSKCGNVFCNRSHSASYRLHGPKPIEAAPMLTENLEQRYTAKPAPDKRDLWVGMEKTLAKSRAKAEKGVE